MTDLIIIFSLASLAGAVAFGAVIWIGIRAGRIQIQLEPKPAVAPYHLLTVGAYPRAVGGRAVAFRSEFAFESAEPSFQKPRSMLIFSKVVGRPQGRAGSVLVPEFSVSSSPTPQYEAYLVFESADSYSADTTDPDSGGITLTPHRVIRSESATASSTTVFQELEAACLA